MSINFRYLLVIENSADDAVPVSHPHRVFEAATSSDKQYKRIDGATHYYREQPEHQRLVIDVIESWIDTLPA